MLKLTDNRKKILNLLWKDKTTVEFVGHPAMLPKFISSKTKIPVSTINSNLKSLEEHGYVKRAKNEWVITAKGEKFLFTKN
jgi:Fe2+ or Zn2+ uptake regulation protein